MAANKLEIPQYLFDQMLAQCREEYPEEACGIMTGKNGVVRRAFALRNAHSHPTTRYEIDPVDQYAAMHDVLAGREQLLAIYHSHPTTLAYPSQTDVNMAYYPEAVYLIVSLARTPLEVQGYRIAGGKVARVPCVASTPIAGEWIDLR